MKISQLMEELNPGYYDIKKAGSWVDLGGLSRFLAEYVQKHSPKKSSLRGSSQPLSIRSSPTPSLSGRRSKQLGVPVKHEQDSVRTDTRVTDGAGARSQLKRKVNAAKSNMKMPNHVIDVSSGDDVNERDRIETSSTGYLPSDTVDLISSESDVDSQPEVAQPPKKKQKGKRASNAKEGRVDITRVTSVGFLKELKDLPRIWEVPREKNGFAYVLDLNGSSHKYRELGKDGEEGKEMGILAIIRDRDADAWKTRSGGARTKLDPSRMSKVFPLGGANCWKATLECNGMYTCEFFDTDRFLKDYARYELDEDKRREIFEAERELSMKQTVLAGTTDFETLR
jgi:hypothetical protein